MNRKIARRTMLKGLLGGAVVTVGLPWLEYFSAKPAYAQSAFPTRFGLYFWGNGMHPYRWVPDGEGSDYTLSEQLAPLESVKEDITVVSGLEVKTPNTIPHAAGAAGILSCAPLLIEGESNTFAEPSIDQVIADGIGGATRFRSLEYGAEPESGLSHNGPNSINPAENSPYALFERLFGTSFRAPGDDGEVDPSVGLRRSVLDAVMDDAADLKGRLGKHDRDRLAQHLESVRELELRLARLEEDPPMLEACSAPEPPEESYPDVDGRPQISAKNRAMCDVVSMAIACDQTRVFSNFVTAPVNNLLFPHANAGHHQLTHDEPGEQPQVNDIVLQLMDEFAYMVDTLRSIPEGEGTVLDHCAVLATSDVSYGRTHRLDEFPIILAGTAGGRLKKGIHVRKEKENATKVHVMFMRALGMNVDGFGVDDAQTDGALSEIEV